MRVHDITCPHCGSGMKSKAGIPAGQTIPCPRCKKKFAVEPADEPEVVEDFEVEEPAPKKKGPPPASRKPARRIEEDETEEEEPLPKKKAKRRPAEDTEEEEVPRKKKKKKRRDAEDEGLYRRAKNNVLIRVITLVVLFGILAVVSYLYYEYKIKEQPDNTPTRTPTSGQNDPD